MGDFKLSAQLAAHEGDVRAVAFPLDDLVVSASRDYTVRAWSRSSAAPPAFEPSVVSKGTEFINTLAYLPSSPDFPKGLIVSGGNETIIDVRSPASSASENAERLLIGHARNVCSLATVPGGKFIASGSWDNTARVWRVGKWETEFVLDGHEGAVWAVLPLSDSVIVTGCADKAIRLFNFSDAAGGEIHPRSTIYTPDVIRALCNVPPGHPSGAAVASASNDGVIRIWTSEGQKVAELHGHESFIYSLATLPTGELVSSGEDRTVRVWRGSECVQTITHPAISVWSVAVSPKGDIVTGASDGMARVFSRASDRVASPDVLAQFDESIKASAIPQQSIGGVNKEKLPGPEFLTSKSGTKDGQVQMIKEADGSVTAHTWSTSTQQWTNVGTVVDAEGSSGRKVEHNGESFDYVFDVAIEEGQPSLKLPYNLSENPYSRAQKFIDDNELSQNYLDQIAQFIVANTEGKTLGQDPSASGGPDPYGTEARYGPDQASNAPGVLPQKDYLAITGAKYEPIFKKISTLNSELVAAGRKDISLNPSSENALAMLRQTLESDRPVTDEAAINLIVMMCTQWDYSSRLAPLDLLRCIALFPATARVRSSDSRTLVQIAISAALEGVPDGSQINENCVMMALRTIANLFRTAEGRKLLVQSSPEVVAFINRVLGVGGRTPIGPFNRNLLFALTTVTINYAVLASKQLGIVSNDVQIRLLSALALILQKQTEDEVVYRALVAVGTLIPTVGKAAPEARSLASPVNVAKAKVKDTRVQNVADECLALLR
ncbi:ubiquitin homeostasis protein lub1 [Xylariaceae sp. FL1019]|nr:ubiquitin homeostasis protein lub1 [Xylariaceae sp. FL1019]